MIWPVSASREPVPDVHSRSTVSREATEYCTSCEVNVAMPGWAA
jgi:hypothetical protein